MRLLTHKELEIRTALADLESVRREVFGDVGDCPDIYADYDKCCEFAGKMQKAISLLDKSIGSMGIGAWLVRERDTDPWDTCRLKVAADQIAARGGQSVPLFTLND